jgi:phosphodiesterase/alkaline phosphatase D-like protein
MKVCRRHSKVFFALFLTTAFFLSACGGGGGGDASPPPPTATTEAATGISLHVATLNSIVNPHAQATNAWFEWGTDNALVNPTLTTTQSIGAGSADNSFTASITGLTLGTTYYYRVDATNISGTQMGAIKNFTTAFPNSPPSVTTDAATSVTISGAVLNGTVNPNELATSAVFEWGMDSNLTTFTSTTLQSMAAGTTSVAITASLSGLTPGVTYYFRVAATNSTGTSKGLINSFIVVAQVPTVTTAAATSVTISSATLNGTVNPNGLAVSDAHFEYGVDSNPATFTSTSAQTLTAGFTGQAISALLTGLTPGTTYYFRVVATNSGGTSKGLIVSQITAAQAPTAATAAATSVTISGATLNGTVNPNGLAVSDAHFEYGTDSNLTTFSTTGVQTLAAGFAGQPIAASLSGLIPGTTYYFRLAATNSAGTSTGTVLSFSTSSLGTGTFKYNSSGQNARVTTGDSNTVVFSKLLQVTNYAGVFFLDFSPTVEYGSGGSISIRLLDTPTTYFQFSTKDALVKKVRKGVVVDSAAFPFSYNQVNSYTIKITFSQEVATFEAFGQTVSLTSNTSANPINYFEVETTQQDAFYDNIELETAPPLPGYFDDFSTDTTGTYVVF